ncbi:methylaspartate ammonia-lyase [Halorussus sp. MSC15.2]|uniref:methylaspartate ammonia-lyase n=1 Tax=Halorussus sp. MSC15.2 TaxID=2283638 RepID=UPI0013D0F4F6|nr:methylaspartate ammonia-lyase [Halorussus sp. MSC15.2]NEU56447.1 methylaspartate ammonia-lyase [Halorussus sp. MSC15.2]
MTTIARVRAVPGASGFFFDDQRAIKRGAERDGAAYRGDPVTPGFDRVRQAGEAISVLLELDDGTVATGDCAAVQYSGAGGRDPLFRAEEFVPVVEETVADALVGRPAEAFAENADLLADLDGPDGERLHTAVRYGVSQALLDAAATARRATKTDALADALGTDPADDPVPVFGQSGDARRDNAEKMLLKGVPVLPHGLFNSVEKVGEEGERLVEYLDWLSTRAAEIGPAGADYSPRFHVDVYGVLGEVFGPPYDRPEVADYFADLRAAAAPYPLQVEGPMDAGGRAEQIHAMAELRDGLADAGVPVDLVADEWCNTLPDVEAFVDAGAADVVQVKTPDLGGVHRSGEAVRYCEGTDTRAYLGGTCNETAESARTCAHVALATDAAQVLAKPGMGFDEGYMIVTNEMRRALARRDLRQSRVVADD